MINPKIFIIPRIWLDNSVVILTSLVLAATSVRVQGWRNLPGPRFVIAAAAAVPDQRIGRSRVDTRVETNKMVNIRIRNGVNYLSHYYRVCVANS
jgi:hypothetical protein